MRKNKYAINNKPQGEVIKEKRQTLSLDKPIKENKQTINDKSGKRPVVLFLAGTFVLLLLLGVFISASCGGNKVTVNDQTITLEPGIK